MLQRARKRRYRVESNERCRHNWRHMLIDRHTLITSLVSLTPGCANANRTEKNCDWVTLIDGLAIDATKKKSYSNSADENRKWDIFSVIHFITVTKLLSCVVFTARCTLVARSCDRMSSVCLSVTLVDCDHIGWNSSEIISPSVSLGCSLSADPNIMGLLQGEHPEILAQNDPPPVDLSVGDIRSQIAAEWLPISQQSQWRAYRKLPSLFRMVTSLTPTTSPSHKIGVPYAPNIREWPYLRNGSFDPLYGIARITRSYCTAFLLTLH